MIRVSAYLWYSCVLVTPRGLRGFYATMSPLPLISSISDELGVMSGSGVLRSCIKCSEEWPECRAD